jgi:hypothetical protein
MRAFNCAAESECSCREVVGGEGSARAPIRSADLTYRLWSGGLLLDNEPEVFEVAFDDDVFDDVKGEVDV